MWSTGGLAAGVLGKAGVVLGSPGAGVCGVGPVTCIHLAEFIDRDFRGGPGAWLHRGGLKP